MKQVGLYQNHQFVKTRQTNSVDRPIVGTIISSESSKDSLWPISISSSINNNNDRSLLQKFKRMIQTSAISNNPSIINKNTQLTNIKIKIKNNLDNSRHEKSTAVSNVSPGSCTVREKCHSVELNKDMDCDVKKSLKDKINARNTSTNFTLNEDNSVIYCLTSFPASDLSTTADNDVTENSTCGTRRHKNDLMSDRYATKIINTNVCDSSHLSNTESMDVDSQDDYDTNLDTKIMASDNDHTSLEDRLHKNLNTERVSTNTTDNSLSTGSQNKLMKDEKFHCNMMQLQYATEDQLQPPSWGNGERSDACNDDETKLDPQEEGESEELPPFKTCSRVQHRQFTHNQPSLPDKILCNNDNYNNNYNDSNSEILSDIQSRPIIVTNNTVSHKGTKFNNREDKIKNNNSNINKNNNCSSNNSNTRNININNLKNNSNKNNLINNSNHINNNSNNNNNNNLNCSNNNRERSSYCSNINNTSNNIKNNNSNINTTNNNNNINNINNTNNNNTRNNNNNKQITYNSNITNISNTTKNNNNSIERSNYNSNINSNSNMLLTPEVGTDQGTLGLHEHHVVIRSSKTCPSNRTPFRTTPCLSTVEPAEHVLEEDEHKFGNTDGNENKDREEEHPDQNMTEEGAARLRPRKSRSFLLTKERRSREFLKKRSRVLGRWFVTHFTHPYPTKAQKDQLAKDTNMSRNQVSEWFGNMRRRIREASRGHHLTWEEKVRRYNGIISGKSEPLPILPGDVIAKEPSAQETDDSPKSSTPISPKFKRTLLHRYLNDYNVSSNSVPVNSVTMKEENTNKYSTAADFLYKTEPFNYKNAKIYWVKPHRLTSYISPDGVSSQSSLIRDNSHSNNNRSTLCMIPILNEIKINVARTNECVNDLQQMEELMQMNNAPSKYEQIRTYPSTFAIKRKPSVSRRPIPTAKRHRTGEETSGMLFQADQKHVFATNQRSTDEMDAAYTLMDLQKMI